jgi:Tfp pilus assembly protein PilO
MAKKRKLTKVERFGLILIAVITAFYGYLKMVYDPTSQRLVEMRTQYAELTEEVAAYETTPALGGLKSKIAELEQEQDSLGTELDTYIAGGKMQTQEKVTEVLVAINRLALRHSLSVAEIARKNSGEPAAKDSGAAKGGGAAKDKPGEAAETLTVVSGFNWHQYGITLNGNYTDLTGFVQNLKTLDTYTYIQDILIQYDEDKELYKMLIVVLI